MPVGGPGISTEMSLVLPGCESSAGHSLKNRLIGTQIHFGFLIVPLSVSGRQENCWSVAIGCFDSSILLVV